MKITIVWQKPVQLTLNKKLLFDEYEIPSEIQQKPGIYYFSRDFGGKLLPFYIGETLGIRGRLSGHLKTVKIVDVLRGLAGDSGIKNGRRYFHYGYLQGSPSKETAKKRLEIVQRMMIRQALEHDIPMLNTSLTKIPTHSIEFSGSKFGRGEYERYSTVDAR